MPISKAVRYRVALRAGFRCEYCLISEEDSFLDLQIDHIISIKHSGSDSLENLAYACAVCNRFKGSDVGSIDVQGEFVRLFNPRIDNWGEHFRLSEEWIEPLTPVGSVTVQVLKLNSIDRLSERRMLTNLGRLGPPSD